MVTEPLLTPVTTPVPEFTVAIAVLLLLHTPGPDASVNAMVAPGQTGILPVTGNGGAITWTVAVATQVVGAV